jgi:hypothetical protein
MDWNHSNRAQAFLEFKQIAEIWFKVKSIPVKEQYNYIILWSGKIGLRMYNTWGLSDTEKEAPTNIWAKFSSQIVPVENYRIHRLEFQRYQQRQDETIEDFHTRCKEKAGKCSFRDDKETEERIIEVLISGTKFPEVRKKLLQKDDKLQLKDALDLCRTHEASEIHMTQYNNIGQASSVNAIRRDDRCRNCGTSHPYKPREKCPAYGSTCHGCGKRGHWRSVCLSGQQQPRGRPDRSRADNQDKGKPRGQGRQRSRSRSRNKRRQGWRNNQRNGGKPRDVHCIQQEEDYDPVPQFEQFNFESIDFKVDAISRAHDTRDELFANLDIKLPSRPGQHTLKSKVDSGAQGNILPVRIFRRMFPQLLDANGYPKVGSTSVRPTRLMAYNGTEIPQYGAISFKCKYGDSEWINTEFYVAESEGPAIIGLPSSRSLKLITINCMIQHQPLDAQPSQMINNKQDLQKLYPDRFEGIGKFPNKYSITLKEDAKPVVHPPRKYPIQLKDELKKELDKMVDMDIITPVTEPTDWVSSLAFSRKDTGKLRICLDPRDINKSIKRTYHKTPTLEEITHQFNGAKYFSKMDARHGYWSIELEEESSYLTTFNSPFGRYRFKRLPFGLRVSQDIFQEVMDQILEQCPGCIGIADDVAVFGSSEEEHNKNLHQLMKVARKYGLVFNPEKCDIKVPRIKFFGCIYDSTGVHPDPEKVEEIQKLSPPTNVTEIQQFLGIVQYMSPFIPNLADHTEILRLMTKKDTEWSWTPSHDKAFEKLKSLICKECTLTYYDPKQPILIQVDASQKGLGAALIQKGKPIAFASKALTDVEQRYANIERELLAIVFGCTRFHTYVYGTRFTVESDHKPLESIQHKNLANTPPRLQRMMLRLQPYDFNIVYKPGREMVLADSMSRLNPKKGPQIALDTTIHVVQFSTEKLREMQQHTSNDEVLHVLKETILNGWPESPRQVCKSIRQYWSCRNELSLEDGLILFGDRIIIPESKRREVMDKLHYGHQGVNKCQLRAKTCVFWPGINKNIEEEVDRCSVCQQYQKSQRPEPLIPHEVPQRPWQILGMDMFFFDNKDYLLVADYYSKFPFIRLIDRPCTSDKIISTLKQLFSEHGCPEKIVSDNGGQFSNHAFQAFAKEWNFDHVTSSPGYPQSNGFAERMVQTVKNTLKKAKESNSDPNLALLCLRTTPVDYTIPAPCQLLSGRKFKTNLITRIKHNVSFRDEVQDRLQDRQDTQKFYHDRHGAKELPPLVTGQRVNIQNNNTGNWSPALIKSTCSEPRSYEVELPGGRIVRRNRKHLRTVNSNQPRQEYRKEKMSSMSSSTTEDTVQPVTSIQNSQPTSQNSQSNSNQNSHVSKSPSVNLNPSNPGHTQNSKPKSSSVTSNKSSCSNSLSTVPNTTTRCGRSVNKPSRYLDTIMFVHNNY